MGLRVQVEGEKLVLIIGQGFGRGKKLQQVVGIFRAEADGNAPVDDRFAQAERHGDDSVQRLLGSYRIEVVGFCDAGEIGVEPCAVLRADHFLHDHRHLFFFKTVIGDFEVVFCALIKGRCVHPLDGGYELPEPDKRIRMVVRNHVRFINAGERMILRVFQKARRPHGKRRPHQVEESGQVAQEILGKNPAFEEFPGYFDVVAGFQRKLAQVVLIQEPVEKLRSQNYSGRDGDLHPFELPADVVVVDEGVDETQTARFAAERASADPHEAGFRIKGILAEFRDQSSLLKSRVCAEGSDQVVAQFPDGREIGNFPGLKPAGQGRTPSAP